MKTGARVVQSKRTHVVALVHGIRTRAEWAKMVRHELDSAGLKGVPLGYGYFDVFQFLLPVFTRRRPVKRILKELQDIRVLYPEAKLSVIAHSFGTYIIAKILQNESHIRIHRLIFCGGIVKSNFPWASYEAQIGWDAQREYQVLNECGKDDIWPVMAASMTWGYGASGTFGFGAARVRDRYHGGPYNRFFHSDYFTRDFVRKFWIPFLVDGSVVPSPWERLGQKTAWWMNAISLLPFNWLLFVILPLTVAIGPLNQLFGINFPLPTWLQAQGSLSGTVIDAQTRRGIPGARVVIRNLPNGNASAVDTNTVGQFSFPRVAAESGYRLELEISSAGYETSIVMPILNASSQTIPLVRKPE